MFLKEKNLGFSLVEVILVLAIFSALLGYSVINLFGSKQKSDLSSSMHVLVSDIKLAQHKSMSGESGSNTGHGIYFGPDYYVLFTGDTYNMSDPENYTVELKDNTVFSSVEFSDSVLVFEGGSGEVDNFNPLENSFTLRNNTDSSQKQIFINRYGAISLP
jgi:prepilin-type N-terminal cleavage/methylation domain-containing protein